MKKVIEFVPIQRDCGVAAVYEDKQRVDIFPPSDEIPRPYISIQEPILSPREARKYALLLIAAADFAENKFGPQ